MSYVAISTKQVYDLAIVDPTGTTSTASKVMMGIGASFTPRTGARLLVTISGDIRSSVSANGAQFQMRYGTGTAPANGDADAGTAFGNRENLLAASNGNRVPFSHSSLLTGLVGGTTYWFDEALQAISGGTATMANMRIVIVEV